MKELRRACTSFQIKRNLQHLGPSKVQTIIDSIEIRFLQLTYNFNLNNLQELKNDVNKIIGYNADVNYSLSLPDNNSVSCSKCKKALKCKIAFITTGPCPVYSEMKNV